MEQKSNVQYRAEKEYKNSREKFFLLLREIISNSIHAVLIRQNKETNFIPQLDLNITFDENQCKIELRDNGEGFTEKNRLYFEELDKKNLEKEQFNFHPLGQGRLAIVYFTDSSEYETVYKDKDGTYQKRTIPYPNTSDGLFNFDEFVEEMPEIKDTYTKLTAYLNKQNTLGRAKTFFYKYPNSKAFKQWFIETFFPFIVTNEQLVVNIIFNGEDVTVKKGNIESETERKPFEINLAEGNKSFMLWLIKKGTQMHGENPVICFARNLKADLSNGKLSYSIDNNDGYLLYLTSEYFDEHVDTKGEKIEIPIDDILKINKKISEILDIEFSSIIENNQKETKRNLKNFKKKYPSLETFIEDSNIIDDKKIVNEKDIVQSAIDEKSRIEKKFWNQIDREFENEEDKLFSDSEECYKLLNSSLHIYVKHRESVLKRLHMLIQKFDEDGNDKSELESSVHELFIKRGTTLSDSSNINHLHNLWILDDKFTTFSNDFKVKSTKSGQPLSDVYIWADDPEKTKQILILELKSTTNAHNAGNTKEGMIAQVKRYAHDFYKHPHKTLNWTVNTEQVQYTGIILARKSDIDKELTSNSFSGGYKPIPFLANSYYFEDNFSKDDNPRNKMDIRIELYSFEDIYELASNRNNVFFKLLKKEFDIE